MLSRKKFEAAAASIPYQNRHSPFLYALVKWLRPRVVVEVGTHLGMSAVWIARGLQENSTGHLWCVDNFCWTEHQQERLWRDNVAFCGVSDAVTLVKGRSQDVEWPSPVDLAYIDGNHSFDVARADSIKAMELGATCIALNDTVEFAGVRKWSEAMRLWPGWDFVEVAFDSGLMVALKKPVKKAARMPDADPWDKNDADPLDRNDTERGGLRIFKSN